MRTLDDLDVAGRRVLVRADLNVPLRKEPAHGRSVADDARIKAALTTIEELRGRGASIVLVSHLGRPHDHEPELSMQPVAQRVSALTGAQVTLAPAVVGAQVHRLVERLKPGEIVMLENIRYEPGETENDPAFAGELADLADVYVNDAFGTAHRAHASTEGVAHLLPCAAGRLMQSEVEALSAVLEAPRRPLVAVLGGAKVADKIGLVAHLLELADTVLIGGALSFPFLAAQGHTLGASACSAGDLEAAREILKSASEASQTLQLPADLIVAERLTAQSEHRQTSGPDVPEQWLGLDIGPRTAARYAQAIAAAGTVFWNGPMGAFECEPFAEGTRTVAHAIADTAAMTVVGGGETVQALRELGLDASVDHVSTGGGATLEFLRGLGLPGVRALSSTAAEDDLREAHRGATSAVSPSPSGVLG